MKVFEPHRGKEPHVSRDGHRTLCGITIPSSGVRRWKKVDDCYTPHQWYGCAGCGKAWVAQWDG